jgi:hypothetical protein
MSKGCQIFLCHPYLQTPVWRRLGSRLMDNGLEFGLEEFCYDPSNQKPCDSRTVTLMIVHQDRQNLSGPLLQVTWTASNVGP